MEPILKVNNLVKCFDGLTAVSDISFQVAKGEFFAFLGVNGAGKSTTINMLSTLLKHSSGTAEVCGYALGKHNDVIRHKIGVVFQTNTLDPNLTIKQNLTSRAYLYETNRRKVIEKVDHVCNVLEIGDLLKCRFKDLSGGQKRRCEVARSLLHSPEILFLDEPTTGLDPKTKQMVWKCLEALRKDLNTTIFLTTHYMDEAAKAEHIVVIDQGKIVADASPFKLKELYSSDKLRIEVTDEPSVLAVLHQHNLSYKRDTNCLEINLVNSLCAIPLLEKLAGAISAFEVVQGTMEDAFLNITNRPILEG
ncbi:MAG: ATP-binding cassette domain-containing protein [Cellulosilyticaceae bacterium]